MAFNHKAYIDKYVKIPSNDATAYGVTIDKAQAQEGETYYQVIGVHHLLPAENTGNRNIYLDVLDENNKRINGARIAWTWEGRRNDEPANPVVIDKPDNEPGANISIGAGQKVSVWISGVRSDQVNNLHSLHDDEPGGNQRGHHSFYVIFKRSKKGSSVPPNGETPPQQRFTKTFILSEDAQMKVSLVIEIK
jgi:hypothetical protein